MRTIMSMNDAYPNGSDSNVLTIAEQTIPSHEEENYAIDNQTTTTGSGQTKTTDTNMVGGAIILLIGVMFILHCLD